MFAGITAFALITGVHVAADPAQLVGARRGLRAAHRDRPGRPAPSSATTRWVSTRSRPSPPRSWCWPRTRPSTGSRFWPRSSARTASCRGSSPAAATGSCSATASSSSPCWPALLIWAFDASTTRLIQLYIIGVFVSFTLSQAGMVRHWTRLLADRATRVRAAGDDAAIPGDQRRRCGCDRGRAGHRAGHEVHPRRLDRGTGDARRVLADDGHPAALRPGRLPNCARDPPGSPCRVVSTPSCSSPGCTPRPCGLWRSHARPGRTPCRPHRPQQPRGDRSAGAASGSSGTFRCHW